MSDLHPSLHIAPNMEMLGVRLSSQLSAQQSTASSDEIFHIFYHFGQLRQLLRVDLTKQEIVFDNKFGHPMTEEMHKQISDSLGYTPKIIDIPKLQRDIYSTNKNISTDTDEEWISKTLPKLEQYQAKTETLTPNKKQTNSQKSFVNYIKSGLGFFARPYQPAGKKQMVIDNKANNHSLKKPLI